jgi:hypothetical protein
MMGMRRDSMNAGIPVKKLEQWAGDDIEDLVLNVLKMGHTPQHMKVLAINPDTGDSRDMILDFTDVPNTFWVKWAKERGVDFF